MLGRGVGGTAGKETFQFKISRWRRQAFTKCLELHKPCSDPQVEQRNRNITIKTTTTERTFSRLFCYRQEYILWQRKERPCPANVSLHRSAVMMFKMIQIIEILRLRSRTKWCRQWDRRGLYGRRSQKIIYFWDYRYKRFNSFNLYLNILKTTKKKTTNTLENGIYKIWTASLIQHHRQREEKVVSTIWKRRHPQGSWWSNTSAYIKFLP